MTDVTVPLSGWGFSTWGTDSWGEGNSLPGGTGEVGTVTTQSVNNIFVSGVEGTSALGTAPAQADANVLVLGEASGAEALNNPAMKRRISEVLVLGVKLLK